MSKIFYDHLVYREEIIAELDKHQVTIEEREEIVQLVDETIHHHVLDVILTNLPKDKHEEFLVKFLNTPFDDKLLDYLKKQIKDIEEKIQKEAKTIKAELLAEIKRAQKK